MGAPKKALEITSAQEVAQGVSWSDWLREEVDGSGARLCRADETQTEQKFFVLVAEARLMELGSWLANDAPQRNRCARRQLFVPGGSRAGAPFGVLFKICDRLPVVSLA